MTIDEKVAWYEQLYEKVKKAYGGDWRKVGYIEYAKKQLDDALAELSKIKGESK